jgi:hypothetical protein
MTQRPCAAVTYRASAGDRDLAMQLAIDPARATMDDAWRRLTAVFGEIDPTTIEIEIRPRRHMDGRLRRACCGRVLPFRSWPAVTSLDAC